MLEVFERLQASGLFGDVRLQEYQHERGLAGFSVSFSSEGQAAYARRARRCAFPDAGALTTAQSFRLALGRTRRLKTEVIEAVLSPVVGRGVRLVDVSLEDELDIERELDGAVAPDDAFFVVQLERVAAPRKRAARARKASYTVPTEAPNTPVALLERLLSHPRLQGSASPEFQKGVQLEMQEADVPTRTPSSPTAERILREIDAVWQKTCRTKPELVAHLKARGLKTLEGKTFTADNVQRPLIQYLLWKSGRSEG